MYQVKPISLNLEMDRLGLRETNIEIAPMTMKPIRQNLSARCESRIRENGLALFLGNRKNIKGQQYDGQQEYAPQFDPRNAR